VLVAPAAFLGQRRVDVVAEGAGGRGWGEGSQWYSTSGLRFLIGMVGRRAIGRVNGTATVVLVKPLVVLAARVLGPGPTRLRLVKLAHNLGRAGAVMEPDGRVRELPKPAVQPTVERAA
jgi:hypothetical protein